MSRDKIRFVSSNNFERAFKYLCKRYKSLAADFETFKTEYSRGEVGTSLGGGFRKVRVSISSKNKGKSGGARIITLDMYVKESERDVVLVDIYDKSDTASKPIKELQSYLNGII